MPVPHKSEWLQLRMSREFKQRLAQAAADAGRNMTEFVEIAVAHELKRPRRKQPQAEVRNTT